MHSFVIYVITPTNHYYSLQLMIYACCYLLYWWIHYEIGKGSPLFPQFDSMKASSIKLIS